MTLEAGSRLGIYEIVAPIGAGGMGEVYRARDTRLGREVAIKILPEAMLANDDRLQRFQREAQSAGGLNHPNLLTIHELGADNGRHFIVSELLDGSTLRERMSAGPLAPRRAIEYASQIAEGLAAAHERGVVHRDLKPENIFVTRDGRVKILDFGLAKLTMPAHAGSSMATFARNDAGTDPGTIVGTAGYMSPEQVRGDSVDARSDIFSLGAMLYEMLSGHRAFHGTSSVDTMHAILHKDPPELSTANAQIPPALERIVNHCLEKDPERRFQSARDLAFDLNAVSGSSSELIAPKHRARARIATPIWIGAVIVAALASWFVSRATVRRTLPQFHRLTFQSRGLFGAALSSDQQSIVYAVPGPDGRGEVFISPIGSPERRSLGLTGATVIAASRKGEVAVLLNARFVGGYTTLGTLARVPIGGGAPREVAEGIEDAAWTPSGDDLLVVRNVGGTERVELPIGNVLYETPGWISTPKISPDGQSIAFLEHPLLADDGGYVTRIDLHHNRKILTPRYASAQTLAWTPDGKEIWFGATLQGGLRRLWAVTPAGKLRLVAAAPESLDIVDIASDGRVIASEQSTRIRLFVHGPGDVNDRELSWLDWSLLRVVSSDGKHILFDEAGEGGGRNYSIYLRDISGSPPVRLGEGSAMDLSPDGRWALALHQDQHPIQIFMYPTGAGQPRQITNDHLNHINAIWTNDGNSIIFSATDSSRPSRLYEQNLTGGPPRPLTAEGVTGFPTLSPDGRWLGIRSGDGIYTLYSRRGEKEIKLPELTRENSIAGWSSDSRELVFIRRSVNPASVFRVDIGTHRVKLWKEVNAPDALYGVLTLRVTPDGRTWAYSYILNSVDLYLLEGV